MRQHLSHYTIDEHIEAVVCEGMANIPYKDLQRLRAFNDNTPDIEVFKRLEHIGIGTICSLISLGMFGVDIAKSLDVPFVPFDKWLDTHEEDVERAMKGSAQTHLSKGMSIISDVGRIDVEASRVAKVKMTEHKFLAQHHDRKTYGDRNIGDKSGGGAVINLNIHNVSDPFTSRIVSDQ